MYPAKLNSQTNGPFIPGACLIITVTYSLIRVQGNTDVVSGLAAVEARLAPPFHKSTVICVVCLPATYVIDALSLAARCPVHWPL